MIGPGRIEASLRPKKQASTARRFLSSLVPAALAPFGRKSRYAMSDGGGEEGGDEGGSSSDDYQQRQQRLQADRFKLVYEPSPVVPPDGAYGWVVVAAAFVVNLIADGVTFSFGILLSELFKSLDDSREDISWIGSFLAGVPLLLGPVTSVLIDRFGCRAITVSGGLIAGAGFTLMFVLPRSTLLFVFSAGLLSGIGLGLVFMPAVVAVSFYFVERRALATGLSVSGSGVGTVVFAYITRACIEEYTWRGSFLIIGGILLNICVCGALYRPLEPDNLKQMKRMNRLYIQFQQANESSKHNCGRGYGNTDGDLPAVSPSTSSPSSSSASPTSRRFPPLTSATIAASAAKSLLSIPTYLAEELNHTSTTPVISQPPPRQQQPPQSSRFAVATETKPAPSEQQLIASLKLGYLKRLAAMHDDAAATVHGNRDCGTDASCGVSNVAAGTDGVAISKANTSHELVDYAHQVQRQQRQQRRLEQKQQQEQADKEQAEQHRRMSVIISLPLPPPQLSQSQQKTQQQQQLALRPRLNTASQTVRRQLFPVDRRYFMQHTRNSFGLASGATQVELWDSCPEFGRIPASLNNRHNGGKDTRSPRVSPMSRLQRCLRKSKVYRDVKFFFTSWDYLSFLASNFLLYFWYDITYTFLPDHAKEIGLSNSHVSLIIALIGVSNTIGQIVIGYIGDFPNVNTVLLYALCMSLTGVANFLVPWCVSLASLVVYGIVYGFLVSANYSLCSIVIIDLFSLERLTTGYGFMMFFQGVANLLGPPTMGYMRDTDSDYNRAFVFSGIFVLVSNLLILPMYTTLYRFARSCLCEQQQGRSVERDGVAATRESSPEEAAAVQEPLTASSA